MTLDSLAHQLFKALTQPSILLKADAPAFTVVAVNAALLDVTQINSEDNLIGKSVFEAFPNNPNDVNADGVNKLRLSLLNLITTGSKQEMPLQKYDIAIPNSNRFETRYWLAKNAPIFNNKNQVEYIFHTTEDVTEKVLLEQKEEKLLSEIKKDIGYIDNLETSNTIGSWDLDLKTEDFYWSPEFFEICGYAPNAFVPSLSKALDIIHPADHDIVTQKFNIAIHKGQPYRVEHRIIKANGEVANVLATGIVTKNKEGKHIRMTGFLQNVSVQKQQNQLLNKTLEGLINSEKRYKQLFEENPSPMFIWDFKNLQIIDCNEEALLLYGYSREEFLQLTIKDIRPIDDYEEIETINESEESYHKIGKRVWRHVKKNGHIIHVFVVGHLIEYKGRKASLVCLNDVTEKIEAEKALQESEIRYKSFFNNSLDANLLSIENGSILAANPVACEMFGYNEDEFCRLTRQDLADTSDKRLIELLNKKKQTGHGEAIHRFFKKDGQAFEAYVSSTVYSDVNGEIRNAVIIKDVTEKIKAEKALKDSEARYRSLFENALDASILALPDGQIFAANPAACKMFQYTQAEFLTMNKKAIIDLNDTRYEKLLAAFTLSNHMHGQLRYKKKNGQFFEGEVSATVYLDRENNKMSSIIIKDITDKIQAEIAIEETAKKYQSIFENSMDAVLLTLPSGEILAANPAACKLFGMTELELNTCGRRGIVDYKDPELPKLMLQRSTEGHTQGKLTYIKKDGTKFIGETNSSIFSDANNVSKGIVTIKDITDKIKAEKALRESESRYKSFFENGINAHFISNANGDIIVANQTASDLFGYSTDELCKMNRAQLVDMSDPRLTKLIRDKELNGNAAGIHTMFHKNGHAFDAFISSKIYYDAIGEERHAIIIKDLSEQQKVEAALAESEKKYRLLFYQSPIPKWIYDVATFRILEVNNAAIQHYGYSREEFLNRTIIDLRPEDEIPKLLSVTNNLSRPNGLYKAGKFTHKKKNGCLITVEISSIPFEFEGKKCKLVIANDITDVEYALKELAISIERYSYVTKATSDAIWDWDLENKKALWGEGFESIFGYSIADINTDISFLVNNIHPDDRQRILDEFYKILKSDQEQWQEEYRFRKADGTFAYVINKVFVIRNNRHRTVRIVGGMRDITTRKKEVLRLKLLESVITNSNDGVIITEAEPTEESGRKIVYVNEAFTKITGYTEDEVIGKTSGFLIGDKTDKNELNKIQNALTYWQSYKTDIINYKKNGEPFWANLSISPVLDDNVWYTNWVAIQRDVTEQKYHVTEMIKAIIKTQEDERFEIGSELHDNICQILATCKIAFKMLEKNIKASDKDWYNQGIDQINLVFKEIRNLSHRLAPTFFKDGSLEEALTSLVRTFNIEDNYNIVFQFDENFKNYATSREFQLNIYRILQEQLRNIFKYAEAKNITISGIATANYLIMTIKDDGIGFNPKTIKGGIGLANMKRRAELFGGKLLIESDFGKGCTITVEIPLTEVH